MIWAILALLGVPLWLCAVGILAVILQNRRLRKRYGDLQVRVRRPGDKRWTRGHAIWVSDVFAWRASPAAWKEDLLQVIGVSSRTPDSEEQRKLHRLGNEPAITELATIEGETFEVATRSEDCKALFGPFPIVTGSD
jgi:hypothetical protein